jgi:hypothetical protein
MADIFPEERVLAGGQHGSFDSMLNLRQPPVNVAGALLMAIVI